MKLSWSFNDTPIKRNAPSDTPEGRWALRDEMGIDISEEYPGLLYCDDDAGEIWHLTKDEHDRLVLDPADRARVQVTKVVLGPDAFRCEWWPKGTAPIFVTGRWDIE
jgi:hypothetical protein